MKCRSDRSSSSAAAMCSPTACAAEQDEGLQIGTFAGVRVPTSVSAPRADSLNRRGEPAGGPASTAAWPNGRAAGRVLGGFDAPAQAGDGRGIGPVRHSRRTSEAFRPPKWLDCVGCEPISRQTRCCSSDSPGPSRPGARQPRRRSRDLVMMLIVEPSAAVPVKVTVSPPCCWPLALPPCPDQTCVGPTKISPPPVTGL
jgi:hypothetical protein